MFPIVLLKSVKQMAQVEVGMPKENLSLVHSYKLDRVLYSPVKKKKARNEYNYIIQVATDDSK